MTRFLSDTTQLSTGDVSLSVVRKRLTVDRAFRCSVLSDTRSLWHPLGHYRRNALLDSDLDKYSLGQRFSLGSSLAPMPVWVLKVSHCRKRQLEPAQVQPCLLRMSIEGNPSSAIRSESGVLTVKKQRRAKWKEHVPDFRFLRSCIGSIHLTW